MSATTNLCPLMKPPKAKHFTCWNCGFQTKTTTQWGPEDHECGLGAKCPECEALQHADFRPIEKVRAIFRTLGRVDTEFSDHLDWYADGTVTMQPYQLDPKKLMQLEHFCIAEGFYIYVRGEPQTGYAQHDPACIWIAIRKVDER